MANASRLKLQSELETLLGNRNVYYQAPESVKMNYPAIRYSKQKPDVKRANNAIYSSLPCYELVVIDRSPDNPVIEKILGLPYSSYDRHYVSDNLNHDVITLYY